jgi:hypothetical protein
MIIDDGLKIDYCVISGNFLGSFTINVDDP